MSTRLEMTRLARSIRRPTIDPSVDLNVPMGHKSTQILFDGKTIYRKRIVLLTSGCRVSTCTMCPFPNEALPGVTGHNLIRQFDASFDREDISQFDMVTIFCNGNFFNDVEISPEARAHMFRRCRDARVKYVTVESLPQYITPDRIAQAHRDLGDTTMTVFVGFQSASDVIRNEAINTTCSRTSFEAGNSLLQSHGYNIAAFLMIKPPFVTESEAVNDVVSSLEYLASIGVRHATLCPMRVAPLTVAERMHKAGLYRPAKIWTVVECLRRGHSVPGVTAMVNTTELKQDMNTDSVCVDQCPHCTQRVIDGIERYLFTRNLDDISFTDMACDCMTAYHSTVQSDRDVRPIRTRIENYLMSENRKESSPCH